MGFLRDFFNHKGGNISENDTSTRTGLNSLFVTKDEEEDFENSMYGKIQLYKTGVTYIKEIFPAEGYDLERQIDLITKLLEKTNTEDDQEVIEVFKTLEEQYIKMKRLAEGEYTIKQLEQQISAMDKRFESAGLSSNPITTQELEDFINYINLIQQKVSQSDQKDIYPLLTNVQRQRFNNASIKAEYRIKMLELMKKMRDARYESIIDERDISNPFKNLSNLKQKMFSDYFLQDAQLSTRQYDNVSNYRETYKKFYYDIFPELDSAAEKLDSDIADASMVGDFSIRELFDSENDMVDSFDFLKRFVIFKLKLNDVKDRVETLGEREEENDKRIAAEKSRREQKIAEQKALEAQKIAKEKEEQLAREAREAEERAKQLAEEEKYKNMTSSDIEKEIYRIEHDLSATGSRFVNILDFQKEVARKKGLLDTESEVQRDDLTYKVVDAAELEVLLGQLDEAGTNYIVFPDSQEAEKSGFLVIVSDSDSDKLRISSPQISYSNLGSNYSVDEKLGSYPPSILNMLCERLISKYDKDFKNSLSITKRESDLYDLAYVWYAYENRPRGYKEDKENIRNVLFDIKQEFESEIGSESKLKDILCYIEFRANENIIPMLEKMKNAGIAAFIEPISDKKRNEKNRNNIRIYFRREDLSKYLETVDKEMLSEHRHISVRWGEDASIKKALARESKWPDEKVRS